MTWTKHPGNPAGCNDEAGRDGAEVPSRPRPSEVAANPVAVARIVPPIHGRLSATRSSCPALPLQLVPYRLTEAGHVVVSAAKYADGSPSMVVKSPPTAMSPLPRTPRAHT